jgi:hypothetical protein
MFRRFKSDNFDSLCNVYGEETNSHKMMIANLIDLIEKLNFEHLKVNGSGTFKLIKNTVNRVKVAKRGLLINLPFQPHKDILKHILSNIAL